MSRASALSVSARVAAGCVALGTSATALVVAAHHPLSAAAALGACLVWIGAAYRFKQLWAFVLPAGVPLFSLAAWTGWIVFDEFDLLVLGALAGGYARLAADGDEADAPASLASRCAMAALAVVAIASTWRGFAAAGHLSFNWFQGYVDPLNSLRVGKSGLYALLIWPLARRDFGTRSGIARFAGGMLAGLCIVTIAAVWERLAFPGLLDFSDTYRTTALFWEMHVGGASIDAYVVMATPFVAWALWASRTPAKWLACAALTLVWAYVCLTTYARGVYMAVALQALLMAWLMAKRSRSVGLLLGWLLVLITFAATLYALGSIAGYAPIALSLVAVTALVAWMQREELRRGNWRLTGTLLLAFVLVSEVDVVAGSGSFMAARVMATSGDYQSRAAHWMRGVSLLDTPAQWLLGIGAGRLPSSYARENVAVGFPGSVQVARGKGGLGLRVAGAHHASILGGTLGITQRVLPRADYRIAFDLLPLTPVVILLQVCDAHLLYARDCTRALVRAARDGRSRWSQISVPLPASALKCSAVLAPAACVFALAVVNPGGEAIVDNLILRSAESEQLLSNGDFSLGLARWFPIATSNFVPWHIDNLYLELLIERGIIGLVLLAVVAVIVLRRQPAPGESGAEAWPFVAAALAGILCLGLVSSLWDSPRVALLACLLLAVAARMRGRVGRPSI